jgi:hypothetical protein
MEMFHFKEKHFKKNKLLHPRPTFYHHHLVLEGRNFYHHHLVLEGRNNVAGEAIAENRGEQQLFSTDEKPKKVVPSPMMLPERLQTTLLRSKCKSPSTKTHCLCTGGPG